MTAAMIGSVSHATLKTDDLLSAFADALEELDTEGRHADLIAESRFLAEASSEGWLSDDGEEHASCVVNEYLMDALSGFAPDYFYFGAHPGDGSDFGFWLCEDVQQLVKDDGGLIVSDTSEVHAGFNGPVLHVNDHGNATLYNAVNGALTEVWSII